MPLIIVIDGPSAAGKSSVAQALSARLKLPYLDSGSLYRALAWKALQKGMDIVDAPKIEAFCRKLNITLRNGQEETQEVWIDSENVTPFLRSAEVTRAASFLSTYSGVRQKLLSFQQEVAKEGVVAEGRDMGTVVFPTADLKFYLDATLSVRGERRFKELQSKGIVCDLPSVISDIEKRDQSDQKRDVAPLYRAADAILIDSTFLSLEEVVSLMEQTTLYSLQ